jgi:ribosome-binding factor A
MGQGGTAPEHGGGAVKRNQPRYPRTARVAELLREIVAEELRGIDDERLEEVAITSVTIEPGLKHAVVWFDTLPGDEVDAEVLEAFAELRWKFQAAVGRQARLKHTPELEFRPDDVERGAERIEGILRDLQVDE